MIYFAVYFFGGALDQGLALDTGPQSDLVTIQFFYFNGVHGGTFLNRLISTITGIDKVAQDLPDIAAAMEALGIANADVIGVSQGGMIAQYLAIDRPDLVKKLILTVTLSKNNDTVKSVINEWIKMAEVGAMKELIVDMAEKMYSNAYVKRYRLFMPLLTILQKPKDVQRFVTLAKACFTCNTYEMLDKIKCPVLVLGGKQDKVVTGFASEEIAEKIGCKIHMYENLGHAAYEEAKDFNQVIYDFLVG